MGWRHPYSNLLIDPRYSPIESAHPPDSNTRPTTLFRTSISWTDNCDSNGARWHEYNPLPNAYVLNHTMTTTAGTISTVGSPNPLNDYSALASSFSHFRPIVMTVEAEYVGQNDLAKGTLAVCVSDVPAASGWSMTQMTDEPYYTEVSITSGKSVCAVARYNIPDFALINSTTLDVGYPRIFVMTLGCNATASGPIRYRVSMTNEYLASSSSIMQTQCSYSPSLPTEYAAAQSILAPEAVVSSGDGAYEKLTRAAGENYEAVKALAYEKAGDAIYASVMAMLKRQTRLALRHDEL